MPWLPGVAELVAQGHVTGASYRNWAGYGKHVTLNGVSSMHQALLTDPQTSGGLLVACAEQAIDDVLAVFHGQGFDRAAVIGRMASGHGITVGG